jgi:RecA/RadA recombinase
MKKHQDIRFLTGCTLLDLVVGGASNVYGYPVGKFINIVGDKSAGKTFLANEIIASAYHRFNKKQFKWIYDDCEAGYSFDTVSMYGFEIVPKDEDGKPINEMSTTVEEAFVNISNFADSLKGDQFGIYVLDSLDGLTSDEQDEAAQERIKTVNAGKKYDKGSYGVGKAKYLSREFFSQLCSVIQNKNILVIIISQVRENLQPFSFEKYVRSGGKAMDFFAHTVLWLATLKKIVKKGKPVGVVVKAKTTKSKTPRPYRDCQFSIVFDYGVDNIGSNLDYLYELRTDKGELTPAAKNISWGEGGVKKPKLIEVKQLLETLTMHIDNKKTNKLKKVNALEYFQLYYETKGQKINMSNFMDYINDFPGLKIEYEKAFSEGNKSFSREGLIEHIEGNSLESELADKVIAKWEAVEADIASTRKKKYATQPKGEE